SAEVSSLSALQPGGLAHGPDEKLGRSGLVWGFARRTSGVAAVASVMSLSSQRARAALGRRGPTPVVRAIAAAARRRERFAYDSETIDSGSREGSEDAAPAPAEAQ